MNTNCPNCGAPHKGGVCEYCGTEQQPKTESYLHINDDGIQIGVVVAGGIMRQQKNKIERVIA